MLSDWCETMIRGSGAMRVINLVLQLMIDSELLLPLGTISPSDDTALLGEIMPNERELPRPKAGAQADGLERMRLSWI